MSAVMEQEDGHSGYDAGESDLGKILDGILNRNFILWNQKPMRNDSDE